MRPLQEYHKVWLENHPHRTEEWFRERLKDGFDIHHVDGDHLNNVPSNLVLIEHTDHMTLHELSLNRLKVRKRIRRVRLNSVKSKAEIKAEERRKLRELQRLENLKDVKQELRRSHIRARKLLASRKPVKKLRVRLGV